MHCTNCGKKASHDDNFCSKCGRPFSLKNSATGDNSVYIAGNNKITSSNLHIGDVYHTEKPEETAYIDRTYVRPITIAGNPVKTSGFIVSGLIGFIGSLASIYSVIGNYWQFLFIVTFAFSMLIFMSGIALKKSRFLRLKWVNLESNIGDQVFITKVGGNCPKCDGILNLADIEIAKDRYKTYVRCSRNSDHIWNFDPTVLD